MRATLRELLHDLCKVDRREKVPPGVFSDKVDFFFAFLAARQGGILLDALLGRSVHVVFGSDGLRIFREIGETISEKAGKRINRGT